MSLGNMLRGRSQIQRQAMTSLMISIRSGMQTSIFGQEKYTSLIKAKYKLEIFLAKNMGFWLKGIKFQ